MESNDPFQIKTEPYQNSPVYKESKLNKSSESFDRTQEKQQFYSKVSMVGDHQNMRNTSSSFESNDSISISKFNTSAKPQQTEYYIDTNGQNQYNQYYYPSMVSTVEQQDLYQNCFVPEFQNSSYYESQGYDSAADQSQVYMFNNMPYQYAFGSSVQSQIKLNSNSDSSCGDYSNGMLSGSGSSVNYFQDNNVGQYATGFGVKENGFASFSDTSSSVNPNENCLNYYPENNNYFV